MASTVSLKSQPLHNFSLSHLKWANNHTNANTHRFRKSPPFDSAPKSPPPFDSDSDANKSAVVEKKSTESDGKTKILLRFRTKTKTDDDAVADTVDHTSIAADFDESEPKTWNLRPRKLVINGGASRSSGPPPQVIKTQSNVVEEERAAAEEEEKEEKKKKKKKRKLSIPLTKEEIEEDIWAMTGSRPRRRPRKRPKYVQKQLDIVFPGLWLDSITPNSYKVSGNL